MTAKDKARELVGLYYEVDGGSIDGGITCTLIKQCALICVDEIVKNTLQVSQVLDYWQEVKQEIYKL